MKIGDLIENKDYDYVEYRLICPDGKNDIFAGCFKSENGEIISLDGDNYSKNEEVLNYEEWSNPKENIKNGLTVVIKTTWYKTKGDTK